jgi:hypothetical protein
VVGKGPEKGQEGGQEEENNKTANARGVEMETGKAEAEEEEDQAKKEKKNTEKEEEKEEEAAAAADPGPSGLAARRAAYGCAQCSSTSMSNARRTSVCSLLTHSGGEVQPAPASISSGRCLRTSRAFGPAHVGPAIPDGRCSASSHGLLPQRAAAPPAIGSPPTTLVVTHGERGRLQAYRTASARNTQAPASRSRMISLATWPWAVTSRPCRFH